MQTIMFLVTRVTCCYQRKDSSDTFLPARQIDKMGVKAQPSKIWACIWLGQNQLWGKAKPKASTSWTSQHPNNFFLHTTCGFGHGTLQRTWTTCFFLPWFWPSQPASSTPRFTPEARTRTSSEFPTTTLRIYNDPGQGGKTCAATPGQEPTALVSKRWFPRFKGKNRWFPKIGFQAPKGSPKNGV